MFKSIYNAIIFFLFKQKKYYRILYRMLGFHPKKIFFYEKALVHKSSNKKNEKNYYQTQNNERLEFLGDAIFNAVITDIVYNKFPTNNEGFLTNIRSNIVKREALNKVAYQLGLHHLVIISASVKNYKHLMGNTLEAFIGAIYLDKGYKKAKKFIIKKIIDPYINIDTLVKEETNFKSKLFEWCQKYKISLQFQSLENFNDNNRNIIFQMQVLLNGQVAGVGIGYTKKESQQHASKMSWKKIKTDNSFLQKILVSKEKENKF